MINQRQLPSHKKEKNAWAKDALVRLRANPRDAVAVMTLYESCSRELQELAVRHFGKNQLGKRAVLNLLIAVVSRAWSYDPQSTNASEWLSRVAEAEARRLREALDVDGNASRRIRRAM
jgi:hypothetical protein